MPANNNNIAPWYPPEEPGEQAGTRDWKVLITNYLWGLRAHTSNLTQTVQNQNNNITQITNVVQQINNSTNNAASKVPVVYGTHSLRLASVPGLFTGYIFVETDRFQAAYYSNANAWVLIEATATGSFENRYTGFGAADSGFEWIETSRNNVNGTSPYPLYRWNGNNWGFISGEFYRNQNGIATLAGTMNAANSNDVGARLNVIDFAGQLQWQANNNWTWGPDDCRMHGMGPILAEVDPSPITGWQLYDGSNNVTYLQANGNIGTVANLPNLSGNNAGNSAFLEAGQVNSGINAPVVGNFNGGSYTPAGTVAATFTGNAMATHFHDSPVGLDANNNLVYIANVGANNNSNGFSANNYTMSEVSVALGFSANNSSRPVLIDHETSAGTPAGTIAANFNGTPGNISGNVSGGQPASLVRRAWFRR